MSMASEKAPTQKVAYWPNGLWCDPETAVLVVELGGPADYQIVEFLADADPSLIDKEVLLLVEGK